MEARLSEVQKRLLWLCLASVLLALLIRPQPENRRYVDALAELESFRASFWRKQAEEALQKQAEGRGEFSFERVQEAANALGGPQLELAEELSAPRGLSIVRLATLADAHAYTELGASLPVGIADPDALALSLQRRMVERAPEAAFILRSFELVAAQVTEADVARELRAGELQPEKTAPRNFARSGARSLPKLALALVKLEIKDGLAAGEQLNFEIPVRLAHRRVSVPVLRGAEFQALRAAGLWNELSNLDAEHAADTIQSHFSWHLRSVELFGLNLSGRKLLQLAPCLLVWLLALLALRMRRAETFCKTSQVPSSLPRVGLKHRWLELLVLLVAPLISIGSAGISLWQLHQLPILPALSGLACVVLGSYSFVKLNDLREQAISIVRSRSYPPPAHDLSLSP